MTELSTTTKRLMRPDKMYQLHEIPWAKYPLRTCRSLHHCEICCGDIRMGERYRDGGYGRRAHESCYERTEKA